MLNTAPSTNCVFAVSDFDDVKKKVLNWIHRFSTFCLLDNHQYQMEPHTQECLVAAGVKRHFSSRAGQALTSFGELARQSPGWWFGHLGYGLKKETDETASASPDPVGFPDLFFFEPEILIRLGETEMIIEAADPATIFSEIMHSAAPKAEPGSAVSIAQTISRQEYIDTVHRLQQHILRGDCYEINFCQEFFASSAGIDPVKVYQHLSAVSPNPFSALYRVQDLWLICASPERFLKKQGTKILSQPIKGTSKRVTGNETADQQSREHLYYSPKDRSENVMVVDLVRNDLAKICKEGTVKVEELYGVYSFPQVHQMISTVSGELKNGMNFEDIIRATFPMGSMTGAPKKRVMELIARYEKTERGLFSGAAGYMAPSGDFDFNVVIRSILYNAAAGYLSFRTGSGITFYSDAEKEWEECLLKAEAIRKVLGGEK